MQLSEGPSHLPFLLLAMHGPGKAWRKLRLELLGPTGVPPPHPATEVAVAYAGLERMELKEAKLPQTLQKEQVTSYTLVGDRVV